jgi:hypothetical protein
VTLSRRVPLSRGKPPKRKTPLRPRRRKDPVRPKTREAMWRRCGGRCEPCGAEVSEHGWDFSHRQARRTRRHAASNGLVACRASHDWIEAHWQAAETLGWRVSTHHPDPAQVKVRLWTGRWVRLADDGRYEPAEEAA